MALPFDALFLGSFAYAGYRTLGRWLKFNDDNAKHKRDSDFFESVNEVLEKQAADGGRGAARMGQGAASTGQAQLWGEWQKLRPEQRARFLEEMLRVLRLTGQDAQWRHLRRAKADAWAKLTPKQRGELVWAADAMDWSFVDEIVDAADAPPAGAVIWQITDPMPQLSEEPFKSRGPREDAAALRQAVAAEEAAVTKALRAGQAAAAAQLAPAETLTVAEAARRVTVLRELLQGTLGLSTGGRAKRGQELMELLRGVSLVPASAAAKQLKEAAEQELADEIEAAIAPKLEEADKEKAAAEARARTLAAASIMQARLRAAAGLDGAAPPPAALVSALLSLGAGEIEARLAPGAAAAGGAELSGVAGQMGAAVAALMRGAGEGSPLLAALERATQEVEALQASLGAAAAARGAAAAAATAAADGEGGEGGEGADGPEARVAAALAGLREAAAELAAAEPPAGEGEGEGEAPVPAGDLLAEINNDVDTRVSESTAGLASRHKSALDAARDRERASRVLRRGQLIAAPAEGDDEAAAAERPSSPIKRLAYAEMYLRQLGARSLGGALPDASAFMAGAGGADGLGGGLELEPASAEAARQLQTLLEEMSLIDAVIRLELGPEITPTLGRVTAYLDARDARARGVPGAPGDSEGELERAGGEAAAAVTPRADKEAEAAAKCREAIDELSQDGLVALGLSAAQYRVLAALREAAAALQGGAAEAAAYERAAAALRQVSAQLGDVGAAIQVKLADTTDEALRGVLQEQKDRAVDLYTRLQAFLAYEDSTRAPALAAVRALKSAADAAVAEGTGPAAVAAAAAKAEAAEQQVATLAELLERLPPAGGDQAAAAAEAAGALSAIGDAAGRLRAGLASYLAFSVLRERALAALARAPGASSAGGGGGEGKGEAEVTMPLAEMEPELNAPLTVLADAADEDVGDWEAAGYRAAARGQVAAVLIATSVAPAAPGAASASARCCEPVPGLPSGKCALQLYAERIIRLQQLAAAAAHGAGAPVARHVQFAIMTSPDTHDQVVRTLEQRRFFGLERSQVTVFRCDTRTPCFDADLKAVMSTPTALAMAPPGSGELLPELKRSGALAHLLRAGVRHVDVNAIDDNILWRPADPVFIGFASASRAAAAAKVVEPGSVARAYSALSAGFPAEADVSELLDSAALQAPAVGCYYFSAPALEKVADAYLKEPLAGLRLVPARGIPKRGSPAPLPALPPNLPPQARAQALAAAARAAEAAAAPRPVEGYALQRFVADVLRYGDLLESGSIALLAVPRDEEFATIWSRGPHWSVDAPEGGAARALGLHTAWVENAGGEVAAEEGVEVSPLLSYAGEGLERAAEGVTFEEPFDAALQSAGGAGAGGARPNNNAGPWLVPLAVAYAGVMAVAVAKSVAKAAGKA